MPDLSKLNEAQRRAVTWDGGPLLLLAGPGSGKTFTIANRILYLLEQGTPPESILVITFTKEAAISMQRRFREMSDRIYPVNFGTFHSVFYHILQESGGFRQITVLRDSQKKNLMITTLRKYRQRAGGEASWEELADDAPRVLAAVSLYKNTGDWKHAAEKAPSAWQSCLKEILEDYGKAVRADGRLDFDDMLFECRRLLEENREIRKHWRGRFRHILIDEFQDINPIQYEVIKLIADRDCPVFAVGDDDQAIYGFRGSRPEILKKFLEEFGAERQLLNINYRSRKEIVDASLAVIGENKNRFPKKLRAAPGRGEPAGDVFGVQLRAFADRDAQYAYLLEQLKRWRQNHGEDGTSCAVLFRTNAHMQGMAARFAGAGIPYVMKERAKSIYEHFIVKDVMAYLLLAAGEWSRELLLRVINRPSRYVGREAVGDGRTIREIMAYYEREYCPERGGREILSRLETLERQLKSMSAMRPGLAVRYVLKAVEYERYLRGLAVGNADKMAEWQEMLEWLKADGDRFADVREWAEAQRCYTEQMEQGTKREEEKTPAGAVRLMTVHGSKGLEFDTVFIPDCNERVFPHGSMPEEETVEEERRLFYVAMTRAKENLELLYLTDDKTRPRLSSRFLNPLVSRFYGSSISSSNSQLSRYSSKASETFSYSSSSSI